jgi:hypothetical protein
VGYTYNTFYMRSFLHKTIFFFALLGVFLPSLSFADTLSFSPASGSYTSGKTFSVNVFVSSTIQPVNAISGEVSFPADKLQLVSISKTGTILTLWVQEPTFSNTQGTVSFAGVVPNPGFVGSFGNLLTLNFKVVGQGNATVKFSSGEVLANDGNGTNILKNLNKGTYSLGVSTVTVPVPEEVQTSSSVLDAPKITSSTYPDSVVWYRETTGQFSWKVPGDVTASKVLLGKFPKSDPTVVYEPPISSKEIKNIGDGVWYLHVSLKNEDGWGKTGHYLFKVDTMPPETFTVRELTRNDNTDPQPRFAFSATDLTSGINHYTIAIDSGGPIEWRDDGTGVYQTKPIGPGKHTLVARAYDEAGNSASASADFEIEPIESPVILSYNEEINDDSPLTVRGTALEGVSVHLKLEREDGEVLEVITKPNAKGEFLGAFAGPVTRGVYKLSAISVDERGAQSNPTSAKTVLVKTSWLMSFGSKALSALSVLVPIFGLLLLIILLVLYGLHKVRAMRKNLQRELYGIERMVDKAFDLLKEDIEDSIHLLEHTKGKRKLTEEEDIIIKRLRKNIEDAEKAIHKEVEQAEKDIG